MSNFPKNIWRSSKLTAFFIGLGWLFDRRGFLKIILEVLKEIEGRVIRGFVIRHKETEIQGKPVEWPETWYNEAEREVERCMVHSAKGEGIWEEIMRILGKFFKIFLYIDNTYRHRVQDCLSENKDLFGTLEVLLQREHGPINTWKYTKWILKVGLLTSPALKRITTRFFKNLNRDKIKMDKDDIYWSLTYKSYDFRGLSYEARRAEREKLSRQNKVVYL